MSKPVLAGKRIFVVEDDVTNMAIIAVLLKQNGATVVQDFWNSSTLQMLEVYLPFDIILLDLMLRAGTSGYQIFEKVRSLPNLAHIPVVAVSASDPALEIPRTQELGFDGFIGKPIDPRQFPNQILEVINGQSVWEART